MADDDVRQERSEAREDFVPARDYTDFSAPGFRETGGWPTPNINALRYEESIENREQARIDAIRINEEQQARAQTAWTRDFSFGPIVKPANNTLRALKRELRQGAADGDETKDFQFSGRKYGVFDAVLLHEAGVDEKDNSLSPAFNPDHPYYQKYAPLRRNLAILRDEIMVMQFPDGEFKSGKLNPDAKEDARNLAKVQQMALALGKELGGVRERPGIARRWLNSTSRLLSGQDLAKPTTSAFMEAANVPDQGIATMYQFLRDQQGKSTMMDALMVQLTPSKWDLPPIEQTPFSKENMQLYSRSSAMANIANALDNVTANVRSVDSLSAHDKAISVEEARNILEKLRIKINSNRENEHLDAGDPRRREASALLNAAIAFQDSMAALVQIDPSVLKNPYLIQAAQALEHANYQVKAEAVKMLREEGKPRAAEAMQARVLETSEQYRKPMPLNEIMTRLETGLSVAGKLENKHESRLSELRAGRANQVNQQVIAAQQAAAARKRAKSAAPQKSAPVDNGTFFKTQVAQVSHPGVVPAAKHVNDNASAPYLTIPGRKI